jgi:Holliday junction DNA helicase RuvA
MIGYIKGKVVYLGNGYLIVDTGGVGYKAHVSLQDLRNVDDSVELFIYHNIREDASDLYGFSNSSDLEIFEMLLSVNGVGPKAAMSIVSSLGKDKIIQAIIDSDQNLFKTISGIGAKVAAKIIVELKNKVSKGEVGVSFLDQSDETVEALVALGLKKQEILPILKDIPKELIDTQDKVKFVLKHVKSRQ